MVCELYLNKEVGKQKKKEKGSSSSLKQTDQDRVPARETMEMSENMLEQENAEWEVICILMGGETR